MADSQDSQSRTLNPGLAAAAALVLMIMATVMWAAITAAEPDGNETQGEISMPAMWLEPSGHIRRPSHPHF